MGRRHVVRRKLRFPRAPRAMALYRPHARGAEADSGQVKAGQGVDIDRAVLLGLTLRRRRLSHAYFPNDEGIARLRPGNARLLPCLFTLICSHGWAGRRILRAPSVRNGSFFSFRAAWAQPAV